MVLTQPITAHWIKLLVYEVTAVFQMALNRPLAGILHILNSACRLNKPVERNDEESKFFFLFKTRIKEEKK